jgi:hypothetical protein
MPVALNKSRLCDQIVFLEVAEARGAKMDARRYLAAARAVRQTVARELGTLPMEAFVGGVLPSLQTTAENIFFEGHRRFADLDGSGHARRAQALSDRLMQRLRGMQPGAA